MKLTVDVLNSANAPNTVGSVLDGVTSSNILS